MKLKCITIIHSHYCTFWYYVIQQKKKGNIFSDWYDVERIWDDSWHGAVWCRKPGLPDAETEMQKLIDSDNNGTNILIYSKL